MEIYSHQLRSRGTTLDTDASPITRLSQRPPSSQPQPTVADFEDFGSAFGRSSSRSQSRALTPSHAPAKRGASRTSTSIRSDWSDYDATAESSDDEIDFLSGSSRHGSADPMPRKGSAALSS